MKAALNNQVPFEKYFEEICQYPHGSFNEQLLSDHLVEFARDNNLLYKQDEMGNVVIYKGGSVGYESHPPVIIQAHIDMICEKRPGYQHDFLKDPLEIYVEDGWIRARGTTLGGDDGVGVAYMMAILTDSGLKHPPLECLFTVQEEEGCAGAACLKAEDFQAVQLLSLDEMSGNATTVSGAGMKRLTIRYEAEKEAVGKQFYELTVSGLIGGHSGDDIHKERGNANKIAGRLLYELARKDSSLQLATVNGGIVDNAISRTCTAVFASERAATVVSEDTADILKLIREEYMYSDAGVTADIKICEQEKVFTLKDTDNIVKFLYTCPDSCRHRSMHLDLTTASSNLGILKTEDGVLTASDYIRGASASFVDTIAGEITVLADLHGWNSEVSVSLPCWEYREASPLRAKLKAAYGSVTGAKMHEHAEHGCLEAGHFTAMKPEMDIATLGPCVKGYHTFDECIDRASFAQIYDVLTAVLELL